MGITWPVAAIAYFLVQVASLLDTEGHGGRYNPVIQSVCFHLAAANASALPVLPAASNASIASP